MRSHKQQTNTNMKITYSKNGTEYAQFQPMGHHPLLINLLELNVLIANNINQLEAQCYPQFFSSHGLMNIDDIPRQIGEPCDFLFYPIVAWELARQAGKISFEDRPRLLGEVLPAFLDLYTHVETYTEARPELIETIIWIRAEHRNHCFIVLSDRPYYQALGRLRNIGLEGLVNGVIGVRREHPQILNDYGREVDFIHDWVERQIAKSNLERLQVVGGVPATDDGLWTLQGRVAEMMANPGESSLIMGFDSKPRRMDPLISTFKKRGLKAYFIHAKNSSFEKATTEAVDASFNAIPQLPHIINPLIASQGVGRRHKIRV